MSVPGSASEGTLAGLANQETASVMSFNSSNMSSGSLRVSDQHLVTRQLGTKVTELADSFRSCKVDCRSTNRFPQLRQQCSDELGCYDVDINDFEYF